MKIKIEFEIEGKVDKDEFIDTLMCAMDNWTDTSLDKCISTRLIK